MGQEEGALLTILIVVGSIQKIRRGAIRYLSKDSGGYGLSDREVILKMLDNIVQLIFFTSLIFPMS